MIKKLYNRIKKVFSKKQNFYCDENKVGESKIIYSESGNYYLVISEYKTKPGCWNYTRGIIFRRNDHKLIADIKRNYSSFFHCFVKNKFGIEYLICGENYMQQTVVDLHKEKIYKSKDLCKDNSFCWSNCQFDVENNVLIVNGCYWASPYEVKFFDFSVPERGWNEIKWANKEEACFVYNWFSLDEIEHTSRYFYDLIEKCDYIPKHKMFEDEYDRLGYSYKDLDDSDYEERVKSKIKIYLSRLEYDKIHLESIHTDEKYYDFLNKNIKTETEERKVWDKFKNII